MKKYAPFFIIFLTMALIPGIIFVLFSKAASGTNSGDIPAPETPQGLSSELEKQTTHYLVRLHPVNGTLKTGRQVLQLEILNRDTGSHWEGSPRVRMSMPMGAHPMTAPVEITPLCNAGVYKLETNFSMPGGWALRLQMDNPRETVNLSFYVQSQP